MTINKIYLIICFIVLSISKAYSIGKSDSLYKILKIYTRGDYHVIHAQRNDSLFKIISKKVLPDKKANLEQLKKGKYYYFDFGGEDNDTTKAKIDPLKGVMNYLDVKNNKFFIDGETKIKFTKRFHCRLYKTKNLIGLYYVPRR